MQYVPPADRASYEAVQLSRETKFAYCKTAAADVQRYVSVIQLDRARQRATGPLGPLLCLGVRNGREADLFRVFTQGAGLWQRVLRLGERRRFGYTSRWPWLESFGRSRWRDLRPASTLLDATSARLCLGVELSPLVQRSDVWNGSFDAVPAAWSGAFGLVFSNAFDHAYEPVSTAAHWWALVRRGGYLVLDFGNPSEAGSAIGPVGGFDLADVFKLFPGRLVYYHARGSEIGYSTFILRKD